MTAVASLQTEYAPGGPKPSYQFPSWGSTVEEVDFDDQLHALEDLPALTADTSPQRGDNLEAESSTKEAGETLGQWRWRGMSQVLTRIVAESENEVFFDGKESKLSAIVEVLILNFGVRAVKAIEDEMKSTGPIVTEEILRILGSVDDPISRGERLEVILSCIQSPDARIRDAVSLGIAAIDDPSAIAAVEEALEREDTSIMRNSFQLVLDQLRDTQCHHLSFE